MRDTPELKIEYVIGGLPNPATVADDTQPGDVSPRDTTGVTRVRRYKGYTLERHQPHGFWYVIELPELCTFTDQASAQHAIDKYLDGSSDEAASR